jgi:hypothetical protein
MLQLSHCIRSGLAERVSRIVVRADEIDRNRVLLTVTEELRNPLIVRGGRSSDFERPIDTLDRSRGAAVKLEVVFLLARPEGLEIRLVPNLKKPLRTSAAP